MSSENWMSKRDTQSRFAIVSEGIPGLLVRGTALSSEVSCVVTYARLIVKAIEARQVCTGLCCQGWPWSFSPLKSNSRFAHLLIDVLKWPVIMYPQPTILTAWEHRWKSFTDSNAFWSLGRWGARRFICGQLSTLCVSRQQQNGGLW